MKRFAACLFVFVLIVISCSVTFAEGNNLLKNAGFEEGDSPYFWDKNVWDQDPASTTINLTNAEAHSGKNSVMIKNTKENDARLKQTLAVNPSTIYKISGWVKTMDVATNNKGANLSAEMLLETSDDIKGTSDGWKQIEFYGRTGGEQSTLVLTLGLGGYGSLNTGTAYFDDLTVETVTNLPKDAKIINLYNPQSNNPGTEDPKGSGNGKIWLITLAGILILLIAAVVIFVLITPRKTVSTSTKTTTDGKEAVPAQQTAPSFKIDKKDWLIMGGMFLVYLIIALVNLGGFNVPETHWKPTTSGESFILNLDKEYDVSRISYYNNVGDGKYSVMYLSKDQKYLPIATLNQDVYNVFRWQFTDIQIKTSKLKFMVDSPGAALNEIVLFDKATKKPIKGFTITKVEINDKDEGKVENLFDEQDKYEYNPTYMTSTYFDEIYHPRTAYENIHGMEPYETTHPPLGKLILAIGIAVFGMNPFGWRIMGTLFGALMVPAMYLLGKRLFYKRIFAFISAFLMMFDLMHYAQTRIGTIDSYPTLFLLLAYFFFAGSFLKKSYKMTFKQALKPLLLASVFWGLASASKWTAVYAGGAMGLLFVISKLIELNDYNKAIKNPIKGKIPKWTKDFIPKNFIGISILCLLIFIIIPSILYASSYLPIITLPGPNHDVNEIFRYQKNMFDYHANLTATHPYQSPAWSWPFDTKPLLEYRDTNLPANKVSMMYVLGNPAIYWIGIFSVFFAILIGIWKRDRRVIFLVIAFAFQYLPWFRVSRCIFIYHFFTAVPFMMLCLVYVIKWLHDDFPRIIGKAYMSKNAELTASQVVRIGIYTYLVIVAIFFIWFYPAISGMVIDSSYLNYVKWLNVI